MALFPFFRNIEGKQGLIIGGGKQALEKIQRMLSYGPNLQVIAQEIVPEIRAMEKVELVERGFRNSDLESQPSFVIAAGEDQEENHRIAELCREMRILVNVVDDPQYCDFVFPSLITHGSLSIGICTDGASPSTSVLLKRKIEQQIPENMEAILDYLQEKRPVIRQAFPDKKKRSAFYYHLSELCIKENRPLTEAEFQDLLHAAKFS